MSSEQLSIVISELEQGIENHQIWFTQLHEGMLCKQPFLETVTHPQAHTKCQLGCWLYEKANNLIHQYPQFEHLVAIHKEMHDEARQLVKLWQKTNEVKLANYRSFLDHQRKVMDLLNNQREEILHLQESLDPLTELINRRYMDVILKKNHAFSVRHEQPLVIAMLDLDYFKSVNDNYGHLAGDEVLKATSKCLSSSLRDLDYICRYGGEEFLVMLPKTTLDDSYKVMERVREGIEQSIIDFGETEIKVTVSIGLSSFEAGKSLEDLISQADEALYAAKLKGRNQVIAYTSRLPFQS